jgi:hypothetical protein
MSHAAKYHLNTAQQNGPFCTKGFGVILAVYSTVHVTDSAPLACVSAADGNTEKYAGPVTPSCIPSTGIMPNSFTNMASVQTYSYRNGEHTQGTRRYTLGRQLSHLSLGLLVLLPQPLADSAVAQACSQLTSARRTAVRQQ